MVRVVDNTDSRGFDSLPDIATIIDVETTTYNKGHPFDPRNKLISYAYLSTDGTNVFKYYNDPDFFNTPSCFPLLVGFNIKFDLHWFLNLQPSYNLQQGKIWDCQLAEHILTGQQSPYLSLNDALESYGLPVKLDKVKEYWEAGIDTAAIPVDVLEEYNKHDVMMTYELYKAQRSIMTREQVNLLLQEGEDMKTLIAAERVGFKWDKQKAENVKEIIKLELGKIYSQLLTYLPNIFNDGRFVFNFDSGDQLSALLYGGNIVYDFAVESEECYKSGPKKDQAYTRRRWFTQDVSFSPRFTPIKGTEVKKTKNLQTAITRFYQVDDPTLQQLKSKKKEDQTLLQLLRKRSEKTKVVEMIESIEKIIETKNWQDGCIHGQYNQNVAVTGRLSSSSPNLQNTPPELDELLVSRYND